MNPKQYREQFDNAKNQVERNNINKKFENFIHRRNIFKKISKIFMSILPVLDFFVAISGLVIAIIALFKQ